MSEFSISDTNLITQDKRFIEAVDLFNSNKWYPAHDLFEELWHETIGPERKTLQGILQIAVAQLHLENGNFKGATILYGEGLGRLSDFSSPHLGYDITNLCLIVKQRLSLLQKNEDPNLCNQPVLNKKH